MEAGSSSKNVGKAEGKVGGRRLGSMFSKIDPFVGRTDHNPRELRSWAKKTGFVSTFSGKLIAAQVRSLIAAGLIWREMLIGEVGGPRLK